MTEASSETLVSLVTGGSRGIGHAAVDALAREGHRVYFCSKSPESVQQAERDFRGRFGDRVFGQALDVRDPDAVDGWVSRVESEAGRVDVMVNNAGLGHFAGVTELTTEQWREVIDTNLTGAFFVLRAAARSMVRRERGWIFNIASLAGRNAFSGGGAYNASKFGLVGLSEAAMLDLRHEGVRVTTVLPGSVATDFHSREDHEWMMHSEDVARVIVDFLRFPERTLPSSIELRPSQPPR